MYTLQVANTISVQAEVSKLLRQPEFAPLLDDIGSLPPLCDRSQLKDRSSFWFGPAGTVTPLHHDTLMLFHTQVVGRKRWRFVSPLEWSRVYNLRNVFSEVDLERPDPVRFPRVRAAPSNVNSQTVRRSASCPSAERLRG
jgi:hypothetical protein